MKKSHEEIEAMSGLDRYNFFFPNSTLPKFANSQSIAFNPNHFDTVEWLSNESVELNKIVGSDHDNYNNIKYDRTWLDVLGNLERVHNFSPDNLDVIDLSLGVHLFYVLEEDKYYIGMGNHRTTILKFSGRETYTFPKIQVVTTKN